jgi:hypothetical protein
MRATVATLLLLVLAAVATGGEARSGDGGSARQLLTHPEPPSCNYPNCDKVLKHKDCDWLPKAYPECDYHGKKYHVSVKNCFKEKVSYVFISAGDKCYEFPKPYGDDIGTVELGCGDSITIYGYDEYKLKGDGSKSCKHEGKKDCKTCAYTAKYYCKAKYSPGDVCRKADGKCDEPELFDHYCNCPHDEFKPNGTECRAAYGKCDEAEYCNGYEAKCPKDKVKPEHTPCRPAYGKCDVEDKCDGYSKDCKDKVADKGTVCRKSTGPCDAEETCNGHSKKCPEDCCVFHPKKPYCPVKYI